MYLCMYVCVCVYTYIYIYIYIYIKWCKVIFLFDSEQFLKMKHWFWNFSFYCNLLWWNENNKYCSSCVPISTFLKDQWWRNCFFVMQYGTTNISGRTHSVLLTREWYESWHSLPVCCWCGCLLHFHCTYWKPIVVSWIACWYENACWYLFPNLQKGKFVSHKSRSRFLHFHFYIILFFCQWFYVLSVHYDTLDKLLIRYSAFIR